MNMTTVPLETPQEIMSELSELWY